MRTNLPFQLHLNLLFLQFTFEVSLNSFLIRLLISLRRRLICFDSVSLTPLIEVIYQIFWVNYDLLPVLRHDTRLAHLNLGEALPLWLGLYELVLLHHLLYAWQCYLLVLVLCGVARLVEVNARVEK